jgi:hypothetical protein
VEEAKAEACAHAAEEVCRRAAEEAEADCVDWSRLFFEAEEEVRRLEDLEEETKVRHLEEEAHRLEEETDHRRLEEEEAVCCHEAQEAALEVALEVDLTKMRPLVSSSSSIIEKEEEEEAHSH